MHCIFHVFCDLPQICDLVVLTDANLHKMTFGGLRKFEDIRITQTKALFVTMVCLACC